MDVELATVPQLKLFDRLVKLHDINIDKFRNYLSKIYHVKVESELSKGDMSFIIKAMSPEDRGGANLSSIDKIKDFIGDVNIIQCPKCGDKHSDVSECKPKKSKVKVAEQEFVDRDAFDEDQILNELKDSSYVGDLIYERQGKPAVTYAFLKALVRKKGNVHVRATVAQETKDSKGFFVICEAHDIDNNVIMPGGFYEPMEKNFQFAMATSKATRNSIRAIVPEQYIDFVLTKYKESGNNPKILDGLMENCVSAWKANAKNME